MLVTALIRCTAPVPSGHEAMGRDLLSMPIGPHMSLEAANTVAGIIIGTE